MFEKLLRGEVTAEEYVADLKRRARENLARYRRPDAKASAGVSVGRSVHDNEKEGPGG
jgi:hypothetical protein